MNSHPKSTRRIKGETASAEALLQAAIHEFAERGYRGTSIRRIATRAGVHPALIRYYFQSKGQLQRTLLERAMAALSAVIGPALDQIHDAPSMRRALLDILGGYLRYLESNHEFPRIIQRSLLDGDPVIIEIAEKHMKPFFDAIRSAVGDEDRNAELPQLMLDFFGLAISYFSYAPMIGPLLRTDPLSPAALDRRRAHVLRLGEVVVDRILGLAGG